jgi:hypothetical protein
VTKTAGARLVIDIKIDYNSPVIMDAGHRRRLRGKPI